MYSFNDSDQSASDTGKENPSFVSSSLQNSQRMAENISRRDSDDINSSPNNAVTGNDMNNLDDDLNDSLDDDKGENRYMAATNSKGQWTQACHSLPLNLSIP